MSRSNAYGHEAEYNWDKNMWVYSDTKEPVTKARHCKCCGKLPTKEDYDGCIGELPGVKHACCGHGVENPYVILNSGEEIKFKNINEMKECFNIK